MSEYERMKAQKDAILAAQQTDVERENGQLRACLEAAEKGRDDALRANKAKTKVADELYEALCDILMDPARIGAAYSAIAAYDALVGKEGV